MVIFRLLIFVYVSLEQSRVTKIEHHQHNMLLQLGEDSTVLNSINGDIAGPSSSLSPEINAHGKIREPMQGAQYHSWGTLAENKRIQLQGVLQYINYTYYEGEGSKAHRDYGPFPVFLSSQRLFYSVKVLQQRLPNTIPTRMQAILPHFQTALSAIPRYAKGFPNLVKLVRAQEDTESPYFNLSLPLIFSIDDHRGCCLNNFERTSAVDASNAVWSVPFITFSNAANCQYRFPVPTYKTYEYTALRHRKQEFHDLYPWERKKKAAYWRGGCSDAKRGHRGRFILLANANSTRRINVKPIKPGLLCPNEMDPRVMDRYQPPENAMKFKAVFDIDGNAWSERFSRLLCYNSAVIKIKLHEDGQDEYIMHDLIPGYHYISADLENFTKVTMEVLEDDAMLKQVVANANQWCQDYMTKEQLNLAFLSVLEGYVTSLEDGWEVAWKEAQHYYISATRKVATGGFADEISDVNNLKSKIDGLL